MFNSKQSNNITASDVSLKIGFGLKTFFEVLVLVLTLDGLEVSKNCGLKTKKA